MTIRHALEVLGIEPKIIKADWSKFSLRTRPIRNKLILDEKPDFVINFLPPLSKGNLNWIKQCKKRKVPLCII